MLRREIIPTRIEIKKQRVNELRSDTMRLELEVGWIGRFWLWVGLPALTQNQIELSNNRIELQIYQASSFSNKSEANMVAYFFDLDHTWRKINAASYSGNQITLTYDGGIVKFPPADLRYMIGDDFANELTIKNLLFGINQ